MKKILYHGSHEIVQEPKFSLGKEYNDYGQGFYLTEDPGLAGEWAVNSGRDGYVSRYELDMDDLNILYLNSEEYSILHWMALLVDNRRFRISTPVMAGARDWLMDNYLIDLGFYDAVIGYRADDSYFAFAKDFLNNSITLGQLSGAMKLGKLGEQFVIKSRFAFEILEFKGFEPIESSLFYPRRKARDEIARTEYRKMLEKESEDGVYIRDLMRGGR